MRSKVLFAVVAVATLAGCNNGQPRIYKVALDTTALHTIGLPSCYKSNQLPTGDQIASANYREDHEWVIWDSGDGKQYLDMGSASYTLADSPTITVAGMIETTTSGTFQGSLQESKVSGPQNNQLTETAATSITVAFGDEGAAPTGTVQLKSEFACVGACPSTPDATSCGAQMTFEARRIDTSRIEAYQPVGQ